MSDRLSEGTRRPAATHVARFSLTTRLFHDAATDTRGRLSVQACLALGLIVLLPAATLAARRGFDGLYGQDAYAYYDYAVHSVRASILHLRPLEPFFWPPGYPLLVALSSLLFGETPLAGQLVSLLMSAAVPVLTALLARELCPDQPWLALLAGLLAAVPGQLWQSGMVVMADTTGLALATCAALSLVRYARARTWQWLVAASAALACATLARWIYGVVAIPFAVFALLCLLETPPAARRRAVGQAVAALVVAAAILLPVLGSSVLKVFTHPAEPAPFAGNLQVYSWSALNAFKSDFFTADGHLVYTQPNGLYYLLAPANLAFFGPLIAPWAVLGAWRALREWPRRNSVLIVGWAAIVFAFHAGAPWQNFRFALAYLPPLAILAATGLAWGLAFVSGTGDRRFRRVAVGLVAVVCALSALVVAASGVRLLQGFVGRKDDELALVRLVQAQIPPPTELLSFGPTLTFRQYTTIPTFDLYDLAPADLDAVVANHASGPYVLVDDANIDEQWSAAAPGQNLHTLRAERALVPVGAHGAYTLYRVDPR